MNIIPHSSGLAIQSPGFSDRLAKAARLIPGMRWDAVARCWAGDVGAVEATAELLRIPSPSPAPIDPIPRRFLPKSLRDYQVDAVSFLVSKRRAILADDMGLGKTASALSAAMLHSSRRILIVCPNYVRGVWVSEIAKWFPKAPIPHLLKGLKDIAPILGGDSIVICHYDILHAWADAVSDWGPSIVIFDEAHALMSENSVRSKAAKKVSAGADCVWGLTGTPLTNRPRDLWNVADTICPGVFGDFFKFGLRYCAAEQRQVTPMKRVWVFDGASHEGELAGRLKHFMLRRVKSDVALQLPPKTRQLVYVDVKSTAAMLSGGSPAALRKALDASTDRKLPDVVALILGHLEAGHKVVSFSWRKAVAEMLQNAAVAKGFSSEVVHGGVPTMQRGARIETCKLGRASLLSATIDSAGTGIDLSYADVVVFAELSYEPHKLLQAEARVDRFGQQNPVLVQYVIARNTSDEIVASIVVNKLDVYGKVMGAGDNGLREDIMGPEEDIMAACTAAIEAMRATP